MDSCEGGLVRLASRLPCPRAAAMRCHPQTGHPFAAAAIAPTRSNPELALGCP